jgi:hypothetical protein
MKKGDSHVLAILFAGRDLCSLRAMPGCGVGISGQAAENQAQAMNFGRSVALLPIAQFVTLCAKGRREIG